MSRSTTVVILLLMCVAGLLGYNYFFRPFSPSERVEVAVPSALPSPSPSPDSAFEQLSPAERVSLIIAAPIVVQNNQPKAEQMTWILQNRPGVVTLFGDKISTQAAQQTVTTISAYDTLPPLFAVDHEGGSVQRLNGAGFTLLPSWRNLCLQPVAERRQLLEKVATELQQVGIDIVYGPVIDLATPDSALGNRSCDQSPELVGQRSQDYVKIFLSKHILPVLKHFPGIGSVKQDLHTTVATVSPTETELIVYQYVLSEFPELGVMTAHVSVTGGLDGEICSLSPKCIQGFRQLFDQTLIFSDALEMDSASFVPQASQSAQRRTLAERAVLAAKAGTNVLVFGPTVTPAELTVVKDELLKAYDSDPDIKQEIDASAQKIYERLES